MATLRKKRTSYFIDYRVNGRRIRKNVGHDTTMIYSHLTEKHVNEAVDRLSFGLMKSYI